MQRLSGAGVCDTRPSKRQSGRVQFRSSGFGSREWQKEHLLRSPRRRIISHGLGMHLLVDSLAISVLPTSSCEL